MSGRKHIPPNSFETTGNLQLRSSEAIGKEEWLISLGYWTALEILCDSVKMDGMNDTGLFLCPSFYGM